MKQKVIIGSRGSKLALWQTYHVADKLQQAGFDTEIIAIETKGDKILHTSFAEIGTKGLFTEELEEKLINKEIDIAVHSAKDMQTDLGENLEIIAFTEREQSHDVLLSLDKNFDISDQTKEVTIGTSSARRKAMLKHFYPHVKTVEARGNLQTRVQKLENGNFQAMILAYAGVHRMNMDSLIVKHFSQEQFTPATGQGSIAIEASKNLDPEKHNAIKAALNHKETEDCLLAERSFLKTLEGGCSIPVFALANLSNNQLSITGGVISTNGENLIKETITGPREDSVKLGQTLGLSILNSGGKEILEEIKKNK
ncbi:MAG: hydroxymethylbilane synthase [Cytophagaceae bacterium]